MVVSTRRTRAAIVAASLALATTTFATAYAAETVDSRATPFDGNAATCADAGLKGDIVDEGDLEFTGGVIDSDQTLTITGVADGLDVTGIVVKGGDAYNVYVPGELGLGTDVPWEDLQAPTNDGGNQPELSHWFVCATGEVTPPTSTEPPTTTTEPPSSEPSSEPPSSEPPTTSESPSTEPPASCEPSEPSEEPSTEPSEPGTEPSEPECPTGTPTGTATEPGEEPTTTETPDAETPEDEEDSDDLALTGFGASWLIPIGALLLIGGGAALWLARARRQA